ncbi:MAG: glycosyltransferase [Bryobacteraceae bacterium]
MPVPIAAWVLIGAALLLALLSLRGDRERALYASRRLNERLDDSACPPATVIVPVKGNDDHLAANLASLAALDYPDYELIVAARDAADIPPRVLPERARVVIAGPGDARTGEKINNLLAAVEAVRPESRIFAFADSDNTVTPEWLRALAAPLAEPGVGLATGYRWHTPAEPRLWPLLRSVWNSVIAGGFHGGANTFAWGGAMAITRENFARCDVPGHWRGAISDDFQISRAVQAARLAIAWAPGATVADRSSTTGGVFFSWIERQMIITRVYRRRLWSIAIVAHVVYCGAMAAAAVWAPLLLLVQIALGMVKGANRAAIARACLPAEEPFFARWGWIYTWLVPAATWIWLYSLVAAARTNIIEWRGVRYRLERDGRQVERDGRQVERVGGGGV